MKINLGDFERSMYFITGMLNSPTLHRKESLESFGVMARSSREQGLHLFWCCEECMVELENPENWKISEEKLVRVCSPKGNCRL